MQITLIPRGDNQDWLNIFINEVNGIFKTKSKKKPIPRQLQKIAEHESNFKEIIDKNSFKRNDNPLDNVVILRENVSKFLVKNIIIDYIKHLNEKELVPNKDLKIAFDFYGKGILAWVETEKEELEVEEICKAIEKEINSNYKPHGIKMSTNFTDKSLSLPFPPKYI